MILILDTCRAVPELPQRREFRSNECAEYAQEEQSREARHSIASRRPDNIRPWRWLLLRGGNAGGGGAPSDQT